MKLIEKNVLKLSIFLCLFFIQNAMEAKKEVSMMEYMSSFYSSDKKAEALMSKEINAMKGLPKKEHSSKGKKHKKHLKVKSRSKLKHSDFRFKASNGTAAGAANCSLVGDDKSYDQKLKLNDTNGTDFKQSASGINIEGELFISSDVFKNRERFPPVVLPNGTVEEIETDPDNFRINKNECEKGDCRLNFWFRLAQNLHIYYASTEKDLNVLGAISIQNLVKVGSPLSPIITTCGEAYCFELEDTVNSNWRLCAKSWKRAMRWICAIKSELGIEDDSCKNGGQENIKIIEKKIKEPIIIIPLPSRHCNDGWNYQQHGDDWECECKEGVEQSPIDLPSKEDAIDSPVKPLMSYTEIQARNPYGTIDKIMENDGPLKIRIFKNSLRIMHHNLGQVTTIDGAVYYAEEIIFHTPAEHTIGGKTFDMEVQIVHYGQSKGDIAKQLILSFLVEKKAGHYNQFFDDIDIFNLPDHITKEKELNNNIYISKLLFDSDSDEMPMMKPFSFYTYQGSLTSPPCNERTVVYVAANPIKLSSTTVQLIQEALRIPDLVDPNGNVIVSDWLPQSNRNIQERNGRPVFYYDHEKYCGPDPLPKPEVPQGHYEKVTQKATNYFFVNGEKPSGLPGAFVVTEKEAKGITEGNTK